MKNQKLLLSFRYDSELAVMAHDYNNITEIIEILEYIIALTFSLNQNVDLSIKQTASVLEEFYGFKCEKIFERSYDDCYNFRLNDSYSYVDLEMDDIRLEISPHYEKAIKQYLFRDGVLEFIKSYVNETYKKWFPK